MLSPGFDFGLDVALEEDEEDERFLCGGGLEDDWELSPELDIWVKDTLLSFGEPSLVFPGFGVGALFFLVTATCPMCWVS